MLYSTLLCKKIARAPGGQNKFMLTKLRGGGLGNRIDPTFQRQDEVEENKKNGVGSI